MMKKKKVINRGRPTAISIRSLKKKRSWWMIGSAIGLIVLLSMTIGVFLYNAKMATNRIIVRDINQMEQIFKDINDRCGIVSFEHDVNYVDFLTVGSFVGSEVGSMNLRDSKGWEGPYVQDNPTVQSRYYEIIRTKDGYFLVPGKGSRLSNGSVLGEDLVLDKDADIPALIESKTLLDKNGGPLAVKIEVG